MNQRLFEAHIPVRDLEKSMSFYEQVLGLELGRFEADRRVAFYWIGEPNRSMLGLWEQPTPGVGRHHFAIEVGVDEMDPLIAGLHGHGIDTYNFLGDGSDRPMVFAWMPALSIYFKDPDGHELEYIAPLAGAPSPDVGVVTLERWQEVCQGR